MCWTPLYVNKHKQNKYTICVVYVLWCPTHTKHLFCLCLFTYSGVQHILCICFVCVCLRIRGVQHIYTIVLDTTYVNKHKQNKYTICVGHHYSGVQHIVCICFVCVCLRIVVSNTYKTFVLYVLDTTIRKQTQTKQIHTMCWTPLYVNKHIVCKYTICVGHHYT